VLRAPRCDCGEWPGRYRPGPGLFSQPRSCERIAEALVRSARAT
jgi:hypothetical protein